MLPNPHNSSFEAYRDATHWHGAIMDYASIRMWMMDAPSSASAEDVDNAMEVTDTAGVAVLADPEGCSYQLVFGSKF